MTKRSTVRPMTPAEVLAFNAGAAAAGTYLNGAYYRSDLGQWCYTSVRTWDDLFRRAEDAGSRSVRHFLQGGHVDKFIRLGSEWVAI